MQVLNDIGLVVTIYDVLSMEGGFIYHSDGAAHYTVSFRLVVFKPFVNEVLTGKITKCDRCACRHDLMQAHAMMRHQEDGCSASLYDLIGTALGPFLTAVLARTHALLKKKIPHSLTWKVHLCVSTAPKILV